MAYSDIDRIVNRYKITKDFPAEILSVIERLPCMMSHAEALFGPRDSSFEFDVLFENDIVTKFDKTPVEIWIGLISGLQLPQWGPGEVRIRIAQEMTQILTRPRTIGVNVRLRNIDKGISRYFAKLNAPERFHNPDNGYGNASILFEKFLQYCPPNAIRLLRENKIKKNEPAAIWDITHDDINQMFNVPESIVCDLTELWVHDAGCFPRIDEWIHL